MKRLPRALVLMILLVLPLTAVLAQQQQPPPPPSGTEEPGGGVVQPTSEIPPFLLTPGAVPPGSVVGTPFIEATQPAPGTSPIVEVTPEVTEVATEEAIVTDDSTLLLLNLRPDLETLSNEMLGVGIRPEGWSGSIDLTNPQLGLLMRLDLEILAGATLGADVRPAGWFGAVPSSPYALARDIRHDIELLADAAFGDDAGRPAGWLGGEAMMRCSRATQALVGLLEAGGVFTLQVDPTARDFCRQAEVAASQFAEVNLLSNPSLNGTLSLSGVTAASGGTATVNTDFAAAFLDRGASLRVGVFPVGTTVTAVARSYTQFSNMLLVRGDNFELFVDYQFTSVSQAQFEALPDVDTITIDPYCGTEWCEAG